jgi:transposase
MGQAIPVVLDGASREEAATIGGMDRQTLRDWVIRFNERCRRLMCWNSR